MGRTNNNGAQNRRYSLRRCAFAKRAERCEHDVRRVPFICALVSHNGWVFGAKMDLVHLVRACVRLICITQQRKPIVITAPTSKSHQQTKPHPELRLMRVEHSSDGIQIEYSDPLDCTRMGEQERQKNAKNN